MGSSIGVSSLTRRRLGKQMTAGAVMPPALSALPALAGLAACAPGGGGPASGGEAPPRPSTVQGTVQLAHRQDTLTREVYGAIADEFRQKYPSIQVEAVDVGGNYDTPLYALFAAGTPPDVFWLRITNFASYLSQKLLLNIEPYARRDAKAAQLDDFFPGILDQGRVRGGLYGLPADGGGPVLFYNVGLFERSGLQTPGALDDARKWTVDAFADAGKKLTKRSGGATEQWGAYDALIHLSIWLAWVWTWGGDFLNKEGTAIALDQPAAVAALQWQQDAITRQGYVPTSDELTQLKEREPNDRRTMFRNNRVAMVSDWTTAIGAGRFRESEQQGLRWDATLLPAGQSGQFSVSFFHELAVAAGSKAPEAAWQVQSFFSGPNPTLRKALAGASQPFRKSAASAPEFVRTLPPAMGKAMAKLGDRSRPYPLVVQDGEMQKVLGEEIGLLRDGKKPAREAAQAIKQRVDPLLQTRL
ncbi:MAG: sugar ABC transporter substrate-binding protein [Chloroflexi bacterium]|nr:sugar ABC transporter substrate-binding protein [Chloroflexota bacterium]